MSDFLECHSCAPKRPLPDKRVYPNLRFVCAGLGFAISIMVSARGAAELTDIPPQPYFAGVGRAVQALAELGAPIVKEDADSIAEWTKANNIEAIKAVEKILDRYTVVRLVVEPDGFARVSAGGAPKILIEQGWRPFLVRVSNPASSTAKLTVESATPFYVIPGAPFASSALTYDNLAPEVKKGWLKSVMYDSPPYSEALSGAPLEYRVVQLYSRDRGPNEVVLNGYTAGDSWFAKQMPGRGAQLAFECLPSSDVGLDILDDDGIGCVASLIIKDSQKRVYPMQGMRLAPDMFFHPQVYRADGETLRLPDGDYTVEAQRGPEYLREIQKIVIGNGKRQIKVDLKRWIDPSEWGWYSGDPHIHAGGCLHYDRPTEGVSPETMIRHVRGEALSIGNVLSWGPSWYYQKQFFTGHTVTPPATLEHPDLQAANNTSLRPRPTPRDGESMLRYDVEVSGFPSSGNGHLILLNLRDQDYPGARILQDWPSWNLPILRWAHEQGAVIGYAHCGHGMVVESTALPNYEIPPMDSIGTQEAIVDVTHGLLDVLAGCDTHPAAELNAWYHMLNCGFRVVMIGETDYPCVTGERVGVGRTYVRLGQRPLGDAGYEAWIQGLKRGRVYCGDGRSHFLKFEVQGHASGEGDVRLLAPGTIGITALVAARLDPERDEVMEAYLASPILEISPTWHLERARIGNTREVPVELIVNGVSVDRVNIVADGTPREIQFKAKIERSSWVALRILPSSHSSPVFVSVGGRPIRASQRSAQWLRDCVEKLWDVKSPSIRKSERGAAAEAYNHARSTYDTIIQECEVN